MRIFHTDMWHAAGKHLLQMEIFVDSRRAAEAQERKLHRQLLKVILAATRCRSQVKLSPLGGTACIEMLLDDFGCLGILNVTLRIPKHPKISMGSRRAKTNAEKKRINGPSVSQE